MTTTRRFGTTLLLLGCGCSAGPASLTRVIYPDAQSEAPVEIDAGAPSAPDSGSETACQSCITDADCAAGMSCAQFGADAYCAPRCDGPGGTCSAADQSCTLVTSSEGQQIAACIPSSACELQHDGGTITVQGLDASSQPGDSGVVAGSCGSLLPPEQTAGCTSCTQGGQTCQANGCYGGWWCNVDTAKCQRPPSPSNCGLGADASSGGADATGSPPDSGFHLGDAGPTPPGAIGPNGGTLPYLSFAVVGDTRPPGIDDTRGYPTAVAQRIWQDLQDESPRPAFAVTTGDYMFARSTGSQASPQLDLYLNARSAFQNITFPTMGNHECTGATNSNCLPGGTQSNNYDVYMSRMIQPLGKSEPYYAINISAADLSWTAKFVFVAANAWSTAQQTWLDTTLSQPTTYTFIVRHERSSVTQAPGVRPSEQIIAQHPYTMRLVGHTHTFQVLSTREVVIGNGGAPLTGSGNYGYLLATQRSDGAIAFSAKDYQTGSVFSSFAVFPNGSAAP